jgi:hypothetical protein
LAYAIECYTEAGWQDIRTIEGATGIPMPQPMIEHRSNPLFEWELELTEDGLRIPETFESSIHICPPPQTGRYRFVYQGLVGSDSVAVAFDLQRR